MKNLIFSLVFLFLFSSAFSAITDNEEREDQIGLGLVIKSIDPAEKGSLSTDKGALVLAVLPDSPAEKAGFSEGDVVIQANGKEITDAGILNDLVEALKEGDKLKATVLRDGKKLNLEAKIHFQDYGKDTYVYSFRPPKMGPWTNRIPGPVMKGGWLGCELDFINDQLKEYFEVKAGALVKAVVEKSPAENAGLKAGDVIVKINNKKIEDPADVMRTVNYYDPDDKVAVHVVRKGRKKTIWVKLGKKPTFRHGPGVYYFSNDDKDSKDDVEVNVFSGGNKIKAAKIMRYYPPHPGKPGMGPMPGPGMRIEINLKLYII